MSSLKQQLVCWRNNTEKPMDKEVLKGFARIGIFVGVGGLVLLLFEPRNSPEWVVSLCSALLGGVLILGTVAISRWMK